MPLIPVTIFTGFLGSGKTTILRNLIKELPLDYSTCLLKNEYGDVKVDSLLLQESNIKVQEMINGCLCCVLVGKLQNALIELLSKYQPQRIFIETSGSAFPAPIALEISKMLDRLKLDGIINVVDVLNFQAYKDVSYTAKIQAQFTDLIILNKWELVNTIDYEKVLDSVNELNSITPKIKSDKGYVNSKLLLGLDSNLFEKNINIYADEHSHEQEFDILEVNSTKIIDFKAITALLKSLPKWDFYRIKGFTSSDGNTTIFNYVFGKLSIETINSEKPGTQLLFIGKNFSFHKSNIQKFLLLDDSDINLKLAKRI